MFGPRYFAPARTDVQDALDKVAIRAGDYATDQLSMAMRSKAIIGDVVGTWQRRGEDRQTIAFCVDKAHARDLCDEFLAAGIGARIVVDDTEDDDRVQIFRAFDDRQVRILVSVGVLSIGFDSPVASCAILARPTMSTSLHIQQGGRVLRPFEGKTDALILDHACNTLTHGLLEAFVPPSNLSLTDKATGRRTRKDREESWICRGCDAINALQNSICGECGLPRRRQTTAVVVDGELIEVDVSPGVVLPGPTIGDLQEFYLMARWHAAAKGLNDGWAYYAAQRKFKLDEGAAKALIPWRWRAHAPLVPDPDASRWFRADFQRTRIAKRHREQSQSHA